jgi:hypothetical protein
LVNARFLSSALFVERRDGAHIYRDQLAISGNQQI